MTKMTLKYDSFAVETERLAERYREERAEARACGDLDFPTFTEWRQNLSDPHAERIRAEERIGAEEHRVR